jgi:hypothetical protein
MFPRPEWNGISFQTVHSLRTALKVRHAPTITHAVHLPTFYSETHVASLFLRAVMLVPPPHNVIKMTKDATTFVHAH